MKQELDRVKNDVETIQKAIGLAPSMGRGMDSVVKTRQLVKPVVVSPRVYSHRLIFLAVRQYRKIFRLWIGSADWVFSVRRHTGYINCQHPKNDGQ